MATPNRQLTKDMFCANIFILWQRAITNSKTVLLKGDEEVEMFHVSIIRGHSIMAKKDGGPKQDWSKEGMLNRLADDFQKPETKWGRVVRFLCTLGLLAVIVGYCLATQ